MLRDASRAESGLDDEIFVLLLLLCCVEVG